MSNRIQRVLLLLVSMAALFTIFTCGASAYTYPSMPSDWQSVRVTVGTGSNAVTMPLSRFPSGAWYDGEKRYMSVEEQKEYGFNIGQNLDTRGWECMGFARYVYAALFYKYPQDASIDTSLASNYSGSYAYRDMVEEVLGQRSLSGGYSAETLKKLITACQPGAVMRVGNSKSYPGHSMVIMAIYNDGFLIYDANYSSANTVSVRPYTWQSFVNAMGSQGITALQMPAYYPGYSYSTGNNTLPTSFDVDVSDAGTYEVYDCTTLNVRGGPSTSYSASGVLKVGETVTVYGSYHDWAQIDYEGNRRWVSMEYLKKVSVSTGVQEQTPQPSGPTLDTAMSGTYQVYDCTTLNVRNGPSTSADRVGSLKVGELVTVYGTSSGWAQIAYENQTRWVSAEYLREPVQEITVTFDANGGSASFTRRAYTVGAAFGTLPTASKSDRTFLGWYSGSTKYTAGSTVPSSGLSLKAKWGLMTYEDVPEDAWYAPYVEAATSRGLITRGSHFYPSDTATRAQMVTLLGREYELETGTTISNSGRSAFTDVPAWEYYSKYVTWANYVGIANGTTATTFSPNASVTREQLAEFMYRLAIYSGRTTRTAANLTQLSQFSDWTSISSYARSAICWAVNARIFTGDNQGRINPQGYASRSEMITMLSRYTDYIKSAPRLYAPAEEPETQETAEAEPDLEPEAEPAAETEESAKAPESAAEQEVVTEQAEDATAVPAEPDPIVIE